MKTRVASALLAALVTVGGAELGLRLFWLKRSAIGAGIDHPHFHHRLKPYHEESFISSEFSASTRTNRLGLRGRDPAIPKPDGVTRILMLGDSFTFGFPVADGETFCERIERELTAKGYEVEVINGGVSGYSPTLHYISLRDQFLAFDPDVVILRYDLGDLQEDAWFQKNLLFDQDGKIVRCDPLFINGRFSHWEWLKRYSALARYLEKKLLNTVRKIRILGLAEYVRTKLRGERAKVAIARLKASQQSSDLAAHDRFLLVRESATPERIEQHWALSRRYLLLIQDLLAERHIPFLLGIYPYGMLVGPDQWAEGRTYWGFEKGRTYDPSTVLAVIQRFAAEERIPLVNTFESFRAAARAEKLFYDWDGHMTPAGHRVLAAHVVRDPQFLAVLRRHLAHRSEDVP